jgi:hypothetical protein
VYFIGLLIVNWHLGQFGLQSLDLAQPDDALAGALWVSLAGGGVWGSIQAELSSNDCARGTSLLLFPCRSTM